MPNTLRTVLLAGAACVAGPIATAQPIDWEAEEAGWLSNHTQLTFRKDYVKAGEAYFSHDGKRVIFQAVPVPPEGEAPSPHYGMYLADLIFDEDGRATGLGKATRLSAEGSANTCGWFHPDSSNKVMFGSTMAAIGGLATSMGTFAAVEAGWIPMGSSTEMWGGLGGMAFFVGGTIIGGIALLASGKD